MSIKRQVAANFVGRAWSAVMNFAFVPAYIHFLGVEAYGLIGFFVSVMAIFFVLDMGFSTTITRELARHETTSASGDEVRNLMLTLELIYWAVGVVIGASLVFGASGLASNWLHPEALDHGAVVRSIQLMGVVAILRWPVSLYSGALMGMQKQVSLNAIICLYATLQAGGATLVLWIVSPTIFVFFAWQAIASALQIVALRLLTWRELGGRNQIARFELDSVRRVLGFSLSVMGITLLSVVLTQFDKILLSRWVSLQTFGYYSLATAIATVLNVAGTAVYGAVFPRLSRLAAHGSTRAVTDFYHSSCQLVSILILPAALTLSFFAQPLLAVYLGKADVAEKVAPILSLLAMGNALLSLMLVPLALQLAYGWTRLSLYKNIVAILLFVPLLVVLVKFHGPVGAALAWVILVLGYVILEIPIMHMRLLRGEERRWYLQDAGLPAITCLAIVGTARWLLPSNAGPIVGSLVAILAGLLALGTIGILLPASRHQLTSLWKRFSAAGT